jgi:hypothetical protein
VTAFKPARHYASLILAWRFVSRNVMRLFGTVRLPTANDGLIDVLE